MERIVAFSYGLVSYLIFLAAFLYAIGFVGNIVVPESVDTGLDCWTGKEETAACGLRFASHILWSIF